MPNRFTGVYDDVNEWDEKWPALLAQFIIGGATAYHVDYAIDGIMAIDSDTLEMDGG